MKGKLSLAVGRRAEGTAILRVEGTVDSSTFKEFEATFRWMDRQGFRTIVVDMSRMTYISSSGLSLLVKAKTARARKGDVVLVRPQTPIVNIMRILGLNDVFRTASSVEEALQPPPSPESE